MGLSANSKRLIVNADDFGAGEPTDRGILHAFRQGIVTSASLLANGLHMTQAMVWAQEAGLPLGIHLNLADGPALAGPVPGLTKPDGTFPGKQESRQYLRSDPDLVSISRELSAQIERMKELGADPDHLDTHQHFFLFSTMTALVLELAETYKIRAVRRPLPAEPPENDPGGELRQEMSLYRRLAPGVDRLLAVRQFHSPHGLFGMPRLNRLDESSLLQIIGQIPPGNWELMVHPGYADRENPFGGHPREIELQALLSPRVHMRIAQCGIRLIHFGELS